jgi:hypothetical protein
MFFKSKFDKEILNTLSIEFPEMYLDNSRNSKMILKLGKANAAKMTGLFKQLTSSNAHDQIILLNVYHVAITWLGFAAFNGCITRDKEVQQHVSLECYKLRARLDEDIEAQKLDSMMHWSIEGLATITTMVSMKAFGLLDKNPYAELDWNSLFADADLKLGKIKMSKPRQRIEAVNG